MNGVSGWAFSKQTFLLTWAGERKFLDSLAKPTDPVTVVCWPTCARFTESRKTTLLSKKARSCPGISLWSWEKLAAWKQRWSNSEATAWKSCQDLGWKKQDQDSWGISKCMFMGFSFLFCDWGNRITPDGKFVFRIILGGILRWLKQICLVGVKLWFLFKHALALHSPASLAKIWLDEGLARTSFGPDHRALPISVPSVGQVYHPRCSLPCRWCCVISALLWLAPLQATYLFCCSVQGRSCFPSEGGHWILTRAKKIGNKCEISKRKCLCHWYSKKKKNMRKTIMDGNQREEAETETKRNRVKVRLTIISGGAGVCPF